MHKSTISLSINPTYQCNFRCQFCYLSEKQLSDKTLIQTDRLFNLLSEVSLERKIEHVDLYGGEVAIIPDLALSKIVDTIRFFYQGKINVITNLSVIRPILTQEDFELSVSWDYSARESFERVYLNMKKLRSPFHVLVLASEKVLSFSADELDSMISQLNDLTFLKTVEIKPYSLNPFHQQRSEFKAFEEHIKRWLTRKSSFRFDFINERKIQNSLKQTYSSWSDDHLYITPQGQFAVLEFNNHQEEYFLPLKSFSDYVEWTLREKARIISNPFCGGCDYLGHCLSEHLQEVATKNQCNGFKGLLDWYQLQVNCQSF